MMPYRKVIVTTYILVVGAAVALLLISNIGRDVLPKVNGSQFQVRMRLPDGTRIERTEEQTIKLTGSAQRYSRKGKCIYNICICGHAPPAVFY
jgi:multidrug efflux pump subunit AcrB